MNLTSVTSPAALYPTNGSVTTPFSEAREKVTIDDARLHARINNLWRLIGLLGLCVLVLTGGIVYTSHNVKVLPYVVEVTTDTGAVRSIGVLPQTWQGNTPAVLMTVVQGWLYNMRRVGIDPVQFTDQLQQANAFMATSAITLARPFVEERLALQKKGWTTQLEMGTLLPISPDFHTVQIEWRERVVNQQGNTVSDDAWKAIVTLAYYPGATRDLQTLKAMRNPLRVFITDYSWTTTGRRAQKEGN